MDCAEPAEGPVDHPVRRHRGHPGQDRDRADVKGDGDGGSSAQSWGDFYDFLFSTTGDPATHQGLCLTALATTNTTYPFEYLENTPVAVANCTPTPSQGSSNVSYLNSDWATRPNGEIVNTDANLCLADRGSSTAKGSKLFLEACDGDAGEIWGTG